MLEVRWMAPPVLASLGAPRPMLAVSTYTVEVIGSTTASGGERCWNVGGPLDGPACAGKPGCPPSDAGSVHVHRRGDRVDDGIGRGAVLACWRSAGWPRLCWQAWVPP